MQWIDRFAQLIPQSLQHHPGFAAVDVFEDEPVLGGNHPLLKMKNALCTPHLGYNEKSSYEAVYAGGVEQILAYERGQPINVVNRPAASPIRAG
mgnify:CR=1 FL=1